MRGIRKLAFTLLFTVLLSSLITGPSLAGSEAKPPETPKGETPGPPEKKEEAARDSEGEPGQYSGDAVATVNGVGIPRSEFQRNLQRYVEEQGLNMQGIRDPEVFRKAQREVIDILVNRELLWQEAEGKNHVASGEDVDRGIDQVKGRFKSEEDFTLRLKQIGYSVDDYRAFLRKELSIRQLVEEDIAPRLAVSDDEVHAYYAGNPEQFKAPEQVRARHILVKVDQGADDAIRGEAKAKIDTILEEARGGADFADLAKKHSEGPTGPKGGDLGFFSQSQMVKPFADAAFALKPGEISDVVQTRFGYHIIKVEERKDPSTIPENEVREQVRQFLHSGKVQNAVQERVKTLRDKGKVEILLPL